VLRFSAVASSVGSLETGQTSTNAPPPVAVKEDNHMMGVMFTWTRSLLAGIAEAIVLTFLLLASGDTFMQKLAHVMPSRQHKKRAVEISREVQHNISKYLFTVSLINVGFGCAAGLGFWMVKMPNAAMWGGVAAILNFLPFFGPTMGIIVVGLAGLLAFDTVGAAVLPVGVYFLLHLAESYLITPFALGQRFSVNQVVIFVAFIFFAWLWGVFGVLLAVPLLVCLKVICERVPALTPIAEFLAP
jgi:predicted PurR-regulated permease PerM